MEMKDHLNYLKKSLIFILVFGLVVAAVAYYVSSQRPAVYETVVSYEVELVNRNSTADYQYGSYYDLKGVEIFTQHLMSLLRSPSVIEDILREAGVSYTIDKISKFTNQFKTDQGSAQHLTVSFSRLNRDEAEAIVESMDKVLIERTKTAQVDSENNPQFRLRTTTPVILYSEPNVWLASITGLIAGWLLAIVLVYLKRYLTSDSK